MPNEWLVGGCGARAVSRKTPIYFIAMSFSARSSISPCDAEGLSKWGKISTNVFKGGLLSLLQLTKWMIGMKYEQSALDC